MRHRLIPPSGSQHCALVNERLEASFCLRIAKPEENKRGQRAAYEELDRRRGGKNSVKNLLFLKVLNWVDGQGEASCARPTMRKTAMTLGAIFSIVTCCAKHMA